MLTYRTGTNYIFDFIALVIAVNPSRDVNTDKFFTEFLKSELTEDEIGVVISAIEQTYRHKELNAKKIETAKAKYPTPKEIAENLSTDVDLAIYCMLIYGMHELFKRHEGNFMGMVILGEHESYQRVPDDMVAPPDTSYLKE